MKILIYGFRPFGKNKRNIAAEIIKTLPKRPGLYKKVFPVEFKRSMFLDTVNTIKPDVIIGLGQCSRGDKIRIERKAVNLYNERKGGQDKKIIKGNSKYLLANIKIKPDSNSYVSYDAGKYVCNYSMYLIADYAYQNKTKFAFIHIPAKYSKAKAVNFIKNLLAR